MTSKFRVFIAFQFCKKILSPHKNWIFISLMINVGYASLPAISAAFLKYFMDAFDSKVPTPFTSSASFFAVLLASIGVFRFILYRLDDLTSFNLYVPLKQEVRMALMDSALHDPTSEAMEESPGALENQINSVYQSLANTTSTMIQSFWYQLCLIAGALVTLTEVNIIFVYALLGFVAVVSVFSIWTFKKAYVLGRGAAKANFEMSAVGSDLFIHEKETKETHYKLKESAENASRYDIKLVSFLNFAYQINGLFLVVYGALCLALLVYCGMNGTVNSTGVAVVLGLNAATVDCWWSTCRFLGSICINVSTLEQGLEPFLPGSRKTGGIL